MAAKKIRFITPELILVWPKLNTPDEYKPKKGPVKIRYVTDGKFEDPKDLKKIQDYLKKLAKEFLPDVEEPKYPFKTDKKTEEILITASSGVKYRPPVFNAKNKKMSPEIEIGGGTKAKLDLTVNFYEISADNSGINFYINAVQVIDLVESSFGKSNFEPTDGFSGGDDENEGSFGGDATDDTPKGDGKDPYAF